MRRTVRLFLVAGAAPIAFAGIADAAPSAEGTISGAILSPAFLSDKLGMEEFEGAPLNPPSDHAACAAHRAAIDDAIEAEAAGEDAAVHEEWHTPDAAYTFSQTGFYYAPEDIKVYFNSFKKQGYADCIGAIVGLYDDNPAVKVEVDAKKTRRKVKSADDSVVWFADRTYTPTEGPVSYGRSAFIDVRLEGVVLVIAVDEFSTDEGDLDEFPQYANLVVKALDRQLRQLE